VPKGDHERLHFHRFIGGVHLAAILLIGLGGEWLWQQAAAVPDRFRTVIPGLVILALMVPALRERQAYYAVNTQWMERARQALDADQEARTILSALQELPPGRTYAGRRDNWGKRMRVGDLHFFDLLTFHQTVAISPYESFSLNADLIWHLDDRNPAHYTLFNVKYIVAPRDLAMPAFLGRIKPTSRYILYRAETSGYAQFARVIDPMSMTSQSSLFSRNRDWLLSADPAAGRFIRYDYPDGKGRSEGGLSSGCAGAGMITEERVQPGRLDLRVQCAEAATLVLKMTFHPNWRVTIDGRRQPAFMVSPSFIGVNVPAGLHQLRAEYRSPLYKTALLLLGACTLLAAIWFRRQFARLDAALSSGPRLSTHASSLIPPERSQGLGGSELACWAYQSGM
jgi:hypothetical protein